MFEDEPPVDDEPLPADDPVRDEGVSGARGSGEPHIAVGLHDGQGGSGARGSADILPSHFAPLADPPGPDTVPQPQDVEPVARSARQMSPVRGDDRLRQNLEKRELARCCLNSPCDRAPRWEGRLPAGCLFLGQQGFSRSWATEQFPNPGRSEASARRIILDLLWQAYNSGACEPPEVVLERKRRKR